MLEKPDARDLLVTARAVLLEQLVPLLPEAQRFQARMVANAMSIAEREWAHGAEREQARAMPGGTGMGAGDEQLRLRRLSIEIRHGEHDPGTARHADTAALLRALTRMRCAVSAPRVLER